MSDVITPYIPGNAPVICAQCQYSCHGYGGAMLCRHPFATSVSEITGDTLYRSCAYMRGRKCKDGALFEEKPASWWHRLFRRST